jgi:hypothetical protein
VCDRRYLAAFATVPFPCYTRRDHIQATSATMKG